VNGPSRWSGCDGVPAIERRGIIRRHGGVVAAAEFGNRPDASNGEPRLVKALEYLRDSGHGGNVDDEASQVRLPVESPVGEGYLTKLVRAYRAPGVPARAELLRTDRADRGDETAGSRRLSWRRCDGRPPSRRGRR